MRTDKDAGGLKSLALKILPFALVAVLLIIVFKPIRQFLEGLFSLPKGVFDKLGLSKSDDAKYVYDQIGKKDTAFDPNFYKKAPVGTIIPNKTKAELLAKKFFEASHDGLFKSSLNAVMAVMNQIPNKAYLSLVAATFSEKYKYDLLSHLDNPQTSILEFGLSDADMKKVIEYANSLPSFTR